MILPRLVGVIPFNLKVTFLKRSLSRSGVPCDDSVLVWHCAPSAHRLIGTVTRGTCRIGIGYFNETHHIDALVNGLKSYLKENN